MSDKQILVLGTFARGGIRSVIEAYEAASFYGAGRARFIPTHVEGGILARLRAAFSAFLLVAVLLSRGRVALLHMHMSMRGSFWRKLVFQSMARIARVPTLIHLHGSEFSVFYETSSPWVRRAVRHIFDKAGAVVVLSESWRTYISTLTDTPVKVIGNFVHDAYQPIRATEVRNPRHVLFLGQFGTRKGIYDLIPAFAAVLHQVPDARLFCGGNGEVEKVRALVDELGLAHAIKVPGWVSGDEKADLLHGCVIFVLPSYNEGLPMAIIEAMSYSMAVVSTRVGGIPELVDDCNGALIDPGAQDQLSAVLGELLRRDIATIGAMGAASRQRYCRLFSAEACLSEMRALYRKLGVAP